MNVTWLNKLPPLHHPISKSCLTLGKLERHRSIAEFHLKELATSASHYRFAIAKAQAERDICRYSASSTCQLTFLTGHFTRNNMSIAPKRFYSTRDQQPNQEIPHHIFSQVNAHHDTTDIPSFEESLRSTSKDVSGNTVSNSNKMFTYLLIGAGGAIAGTSAKSTIINFLTILAPTSKTIASGVIEVDLVGIPPARNMILKWRGKPVFIRHRTSSEIEEAGSVDLSKLRDPQPDSDRAKKPEFLIMVGICTHLGCVPVGEAGDYGGWYCPCHGSHYDISGRIRQGPAPSNMEIPPYRYVDETRVIIG